MAVATGALWLLAHALLRVPCWSLPFFAVATAWPIWEFQREAALFQRRAILASVTLEESWIRRRFWPGRISAMWQVLVALCWAVLLLALCALLTTAQWLVLAADAVILAVAIVPVSRRLKSQVRGDAVGFVARRWPLYWLNMAGLALCFLVLDFWVSGAPDTRGLAWNVVAEKAFAEAGADATCRIAGWVVGGLASLDRLAWHALEIIIPSLPRPELKLAAWALFLLQAGAAALAFTRLQLGVIALLERRGQHAAVSPSSGDPTTIFGLTIVALGLPLLWATYVLRDYDPTQLAAGARSVIGWANPCRPDALAVGALKSGLALELAGAGDAAKLEADRRIERELDVLFAPVEQGVDRYLDWYFSVVGEYERLGALVVGGFPQLMTSKLEEQLFGGAQFDDRLRRLSRAIGSESETRMAALSARVGGEIQNNVRASPCQLERLNLSALGDLERDRQRFATAAVSGGLAGIVVSGLARKASTGAVAKFASKKTFQAAATLGGKVAAKRAGSIVLSATGATALCSPGGPLAVLCGLSAGVVTWLAIDQAMIKIDEHRFREAMRAELLESARAQKDELANDLRLLHHAAIDQMLATVRSSVNLVFLPARDGM